MPKLVIGLCPECQKQVIINGQCADCDAVELEFTNTSFDRQLEIIKEMMDITNALMQTVSVMIQESQVALKEYDEQMKKWDSQWN